MAASNSTLETKHENALVKAISYTANSTLDKYKIYQRLDSAFEHTKGVGTHAKTSTGQTPLQYAVSLGHSVAVEWLLDSTKHRTLSYERDADFAFEDKDHPAALLLAIDHEDRGEEKVKDPQLIRRRQIIDLLVEKHTSLSMPLDKTSIKIDDINRRCLEQAILVKNYYVMIKLMDKSNYHAAHSSIYPYSKYPGHNYCKQLTEKFPLPMQFAIENAIKNNDRAGLKQMLTILPFRTAIGNLDFETHKLNVSCYSLIHQYLQNNLLDKETAIDMFKELMGVPYPGLMCHLGEIVKNTKLDLADKISLFNWLKAFKRIRYFYNEEARIMELTHQILSLKSPELFDCFVFFLGENYREDKNPSEMINVCGVTYRTHSGDFHVFDVNDKFYEKLIKQAITKEDVDTIIILSCHYFPQFLPHELTLLSPEKRQRIENLFEVSKLICSPQLTEHAIRPLLDRMNQQDARALLKRFEHIENFVASYRRFSVPVGIEKMKWEHIRKLCGMSNYSLHSCQFDKKGEPLCNNAILVQKLLKELESMTLSQSIINVVAVDHASPEIKSQSNEIKASAPVDSLVEDEEEDIRVATIRSHATLTPSAPVFNFVDDEEVFIDDQPGLFKPSADAKSADNDDAQLEGLHSTSTVMSLLSFPMEVIDCGHIQLLIQELPPGVKAVDHVIEIGLDSAAAESNNGINQCVRLV